MLWHRPLSGTTNHGNKLERFALNLFFHKNKWAGLFQRWTLLSAVKLPLFWLLSFNCKNFSLVAKNGTTYHSCNTLFPQRHPSDKLSFIFLTWHKIILSSFKFELLMVHDLAHLRNKWPNLRIRPNIITRRVVWTVRFLSNLFISKWYA